MLFITQDILARLRQTVFGLAMTPVLVRDDLREYVDLERQALEGHVNEMRTRAELARESDNWLDMLSLQWDLFTESRIRLRRDQAARRVWCGRLLRRFRALIVGIPKDV